jgi:hypothetical protein
VGWNMKLVLQSLLILCLCSFADPFGKQSQSPDRVNAGLIVPGHSVGQLKLGIRTTAPRSCSRSNEIWTKSGGRRVIAERRSIGST